MKTQTKQYPGEVYIEKREVLMDGTLPAGAPDTGKPRKTMYCASVERGNRHTFIGELRSTEEAAVRDAASWLEENGYVHPVTHDMA